MKLKIINKMFVENIINKTYHLFVSMYIIRRDTLKLKKIVEEIVPLQPSPYLNFDSYTR